MPSCADDGAALWATCHGSEQCRGRRVRSGRDSRGPPGGTHYGVLPAGCVCMTAHHPPPEAHESGRGVLVSHIACASHEYVRYWLDRLSGRRAVSARETAGLCRHSRGCTSAEYGLQSIVFRDWAATACHIFVKLAADSALFGRNVVPKKHEYNHSRTQIVRVK